MITLNEKPYREARCKACRKLICYEYVFAGRLAFSCPRCGELNEINFKHLNTKENTDRISSEFTVNSEGGEK